MWENNTCMNDASDIIFKLFIWMTYRAEENKLYLQENNA
jgi:hypothetical protein